MLSPETLGFIHAHQEEDVRRLALKAAPPGVDLRAALQQIGGWQAARRKLPSWAAKEGLLFPPRVPMEQCSSEATARYKRDIVRRWLEACDAAVPRTLIDLTGGFGIDFSFLATLFTHAVYMEQQPELCRLAAHNFKVLGLEQAEIRETDSARSPEDWPEAACCFADPARRDTAGRKTVAIGDCTPDLSALQADIRRKAAFALIKLSPMLDITEALRSMSHIAEVHAVGVQGECKELLLVMTREATGGVTFHCANLASGQPDFCFTRTEEEEAACTYADQPGAYLYEPNAAIMKCGGFRSLAARYGLRMLHPHSHLYTSEECRADFPGRVFAVEAYTGFGKKETKHLLQGLRQANLSVRNFPETVEALRRRLKLKEGGETYLFATTLHDGSHVLLRARKPEKQASPPSAIGNCKQE